MADVRNLNGPAALADAEWADIEPYYAGLLARPVDASNVEPWLAEWSRLEEIITEAISGAMIAYTCDTADPVKETAHRRFVSEIAPRAEEQSVRLAAKFARLDYSRPGLDEMAARFRRAIEIFREANVPIMSELENAATEYQQLTGGFLAEWEGERKPLPQLGPFLQSPDRAVRERAFRAMTTPYREARDTLAALFDRQFTLRERVAENAGFADFQAYSFAAKCRFAYTPADCIRFHDAVAAVAVPAVARMHERRRARLGQERLRPWDLGVTLYRDQPIRPFQGAGDLIARAAKLFDRLDPVLAGQFRTLVDERRLDLDSRANKAPGGYCDMLQFSGRPFIFMNAAGVMEDVQTLLHEAGHAFHAFSAHRQPFIWQRHPTAESAELASMSMELLAAPLFEAPGAFLDGHDAAIARLEHLEDVLVTLCHVAAVDAFQNWIYSSGRGHDADARDAAWLEVRARFEPVVDWSGLRDERVARWYRQLHIFLYPFYYIEYGIAQLGALQVWRNHRRDPVAALEKYRAFLAVGATRSLPELYQTAGARLVFDEAGMAELVGEVEDEIVRLTGLVG